MNKTDYLNKIYDLLTPEQTALFDKMYKGGVKPDQLDWAIKQIENTIGRLNEVNEKFKLEKEKHFKEESALVRNCNQLNDKNIALTKQIKSLEAKIDRLESDPNTDTDTNERLAKLDALEAGGVDNWNGYCSALEEAGL